MKITYMGVISQDMCTELENSGFEVVKIASNKNDFPGMFFELYHSNPDIIINFNKYTKDCCIEDFSDCFKLWMTGYRFDVPVIQIVDDISIDTCTELQELEVITTDIDSVMLAIKRIVDNQRVADEQTK